MKFHILALVALASPVSAKTPQAPVIDVSPVQPDETVGDWQITPANKGTALATTVNSANFTFGVVCSKTGGCGALFNPGVPCDDGHNYPALVNAPAAAFSITMLCEKVGDNFYYTFPTKGGIIEAMSVGGVIGFAMPMASGEFKVARFSLTGAARAAARAQQIASGPAPDAKTPASDNYSL